MGEGAKGFAGVAARRRGEGWKMPEMSAHVATVFKELFEELNYKSMKRQQWTITNYGLLLIAAVFALRDEVGPTIVVWSAWITALGGSILLLRIQWNMGGTRKRIDKVHKRYFATEELENIGIEGEDVRRLGTKTQWEQALRGWEFLAALMGVLLAWAALVFEIVTPVTI